MKDEEQTVTSLSERDQEIEALYNSICKPRPLLVVLSGPSGVGKDATLQMLKQTNYPFHFVVTATTRPKRPGEVDGVDYHFVSVGEFAEMIEKGEL
jgi:guanylate kinase